MPDQISYTSLQNIAISQELVLRVLKRSGEAEALRDAEKVMQSLNRMIEDHPTHKELTTLETE